jgi:hypothetical protein
MTTTPPTGGSTFTRYDRLTVLLAAGDIASASQRTTGSSTLFRAASYAALLGHVFLCAGSSMQCVTRTYSNGFNLARLRRPLRRTRDAWNSEYGPTQTSTAAESTGFYTCPSHGSGRLGGSFATSHFSARQSAAAGGILSGGRANRWKAQIVRLRAVPLRGPPLNPAPSRGGTHLDVLRYIYLGEGRNAK